MFSTSGMSSLSSNGTSNGLVKIKKLEPPTSPVLVSSPPPVDENVMFTHSMTITL